jgi:hypothetical protein
VAIYTEVNTKRPLSLNCVSTTSAAALDPHAHVLASQAGLYKRLIGTPRRRLAQRVARLEAARRPAQIPEVHIAILIQVRDLFAQVLLARCGIAAARLGEDGLPVVGPEPCAQRGEGVRVVGHALGVGAAVVAVEVLVDLENEAGGGAVRVGHVGEGGGGAGGDEGGGGGVSVAAEISNNLCIGEGE